MRRLAPLLLLFALLAACSQAPAPTTPLRVVGLSPVAGAADVPLDTSVTVRFDGDVDEALLHDGVLALQAGSTAVAGALSYDADARTLTFSPGTLLQAATTYSVVLSSDVRSADGGELQLSSDWSFTTVATQTADPVDDATRDTDGDGLPDVDDPDPNDSDCRR
ncbi:MAG: Ig-like domain-containing protein [Trueperaceae bacterium]|nr:Ig-like domain-containing protein [Trueperaceae bacterium]